ncbi:hypothetical protein HXX02_12505 [Microbulbifer elongatus]|uniref:Uncharacterized protein n=1 Tax=Microbulbifer elongatus TaxID=86173 RepID=A0ABT1P560_9GAMM|nr:hypothetical protein [Microbulbifer elongatus]MCQ3830269.1 hypothetical protein [Microbulbifer elongatus]
MNELIELGVLNSGKSAKNSDALADYELRDLGLVVSETKAHDHGSKMDDTLPSTSPDSLSR